MDKEQKPFVLVTTQFRGVFAGSLVEQDGSNSLKLANARNAIYWGTSKGFLELADVGPTAKSKIGSPAEEITLYGITSVTKCTPKAEEAWLAK